MEISFIDRGHRSTWRNRSHWHTLSKCCKEYNSPWAGFELTTSVVIDIDCIGSCKSNYRTITTTTVSYTVGTVPLFNFLLWTNQQCRLWSQISKIDWIWRDLFFPLSPNLTIYDGCLIRNRNCLHCEIIWVHPWVCSVVCVANRFFSFLWCIDGFVFSAFCVFWPKLSVPLDCPSWIVLSGFSNSC